MSVIRTLGQKVTAHDKAALAHFCEGGFPWLEWGIEDDGYAMVIWIESACGRLHCLIIPLPTGGWVFVDQNEVELARGRRIADVLWAVRSY